jgi:hypothetical protein
VPCKINILIRETYIISKKKKEEKRYEVFCNLLGWDRIWSLGESLRVQNTRGF